MHIKKLALGAAILSSSLTGITASAHENDDPVLTKVMLDQLELRQNSDADNVTHLSAQAWIGKDLNKLWFKTTIDHQSGNTQDAELQALYSHAISSYWDMQLGVREDSKPDPSETWGVIGVQGLAPYFFDVDAALFVGQSGKTAARFSAEYEILFTQRWILTPEIEVNLYAQNDPEHGEGSGLSTTEAGLRLRYEIRREFAPYLGVSWQKNFGNTADYSQAEGEAVSESQWVAGIRVWF